MQLRSATALAVGLIPFICLAQEKDPITADRPGITTPTVVLGKGTLQVEAGLSYTWAKESYSVGVPDALFRYGLGHNQEFRLVVPGYRWNKSSGATTTGAGDGYLGAKFGLGKVEGTDLAAVLGFNIPSRSNGFSSGSLDPDLILAWSRAIDAKWAVSGQLHGTYTTSSSDRIWVGQATLSVGRVLNPKTSGFVEYAYNVAQGSPPDQVVDIGAAFLLTPNSQFDLTVGWHLDSGDRRPFLQVGYSFRF